jgi:transposase
MNITERNAGDCQRLAQLVRTEKLARLRDRYRAVLLALGGEEAPVIAHKLGRSRRDVQDWCYRYRARGIDGLPPTPQPGRRQRLPREQEAAFLARLDAGPTEADGVCTLRGKDVAAILELEFDVSYTLNGVYCRLQRLGYGSLHKAGEACSCPRPRHENADEEAQKRFREQVWQAKPDLPPFLPAKLAMPSSPSAVGCGRSSSTRPASATSRLRLLTEGDDDPRVGQEGHASDGGQADQVRVGVPLRRGRVGGGSQHDASGPGGER